MHAHVMQKLCKCMQKLCKSYANECNSYANVMQMHATCTQYLCKRSAAVTQTYCKSYGHVTCESYAIVWRTQPSALRRGVYGQRGGAVCGNPRSIAPHHTPSDRTSASQPHPPLSSQPKPSAPHPASSCAARPYSTHHARHPATHTHVFCPAPYIPHDSADVPHHAPTPHPTTHAAHSHKPFAAPHPTLKLYPDAPHSAVHAPRRHPNIAAPAPAQQSAPPTRLHPWSALASPLIPGPSPRYTPHPSTTYPTPSGLLNLDRLIQPEPPSEESVPIEKQVYALDDWEHPSQIPPIWWSNVFKQWSCDKRKMQLE